MNKKPELLPQSPDGASPLGEGGGVAGSPYSALASYALINNGFGTFFTATNANFQISLCK